MNQGDSFKGNTFAQRMRHLGEEGFHVMGQRIHTCRGSYKWRQLHRQQRICKNDLCQQLRRKKYLLLVCHVIGNDGASTYLTSRAGGSWNRDEMGYIIGNEHITTYQVVIFEQIFAMMYAQYNRPRHIQCCSPSDTNNTVAVGFVKSVRALVHIGFYRVFMNIMKDFYRNVFSLKVRQYFFKEIKL